MSYLSKNWLALISLCVGIIALISSLLPKHQKIAYAETPILLSEFTEAIKARKAYEEEKQTWDKNLKMLDGSLQAAMERIKSNYEKSTPEQRQAMSQNLEKWNNDLKRYTIAVKSMSQEKEKQLMGPVISKMNDYMKLWGQEHGYDLILGTMTGGNILQADANLNVTSSLLADLNKHYQDSPAAVKGVVSSESPKSAKTLPASSDSGVAPPIDKAVTAR